MTTNLVYDCRDEETLQNIKALIAKKIQISIALKKSATSANLVENFLLVEFAISLMVVVILAI